MPAFGQNSDSARTTPFPGTPFRDYWKTLPDYLRGLASEAYATREAALAVLDNPTAIRARQQWVRETLWNSIGGTPDRTPLNERQTGRLNRGSYEIRNYIYESRPNLFIPANLYVPELGRKRYPAVLFQSGHYWEGKAYPSYQRMCQGLAQQGYVVLAFEPMGQGERIYYRNAAGGSVLPSCDAEHTVPGKQFLLFGDTSTRFQLWDAIRSLDFLTSLPMVDPDHIGVTGHSGGGTLSMLLLAADSRPACAAICMGNLENFVARDFAPPGTVDDAEQDLLNAALGFDRWDLLYPFAPKPLLVMPSERDFYATYSPDYIRNGWEEYSKLSAVYDKLDKGNAIQWTGTPLPHALAYDSRMAIYRWFARWLNPDVKAPDTEPPVKPEPIKTIKVTPSGSTVVSLHSVTPFQMVSGRASQQQPIALDKLLNLTNQKPGPKPAYRKIGSTQSGKVQVDVLEVQSDENVWLPGWLLIPERPAAQGATILCLDPAGAERLWFAPEVDTILPAEAPFVCSADVRGIGALRPPFSPGPAEYAAWHEQEEAYAWGSIMLGKPLLTQRVADILALVRALQSHPLTSKRGIQIVARDALTVPALFAAAIEPSIEGLYFSGGLVSFRRIVDTEVYDHPFANFVTGLLNHTDLPLLAASIAPRKICLAGSVDAKGRTLPVDGVREAYDKGVQAGNVSVLPTPQWSVKAILSNPPKTVAVSSAPPK
jgi:dienelactone hydrolase